MQIGSVIGEVIDLGLVRMHLMELDAQGALGPTGRIVAFSNSIVFQASGGLFRQLPGVNFPARRFRNGRWSLRALNSSTSGEWGSAYLPKTVVGCEVATMSLRGFVFSLSRWKNFRWRKSMSPFSVSKPQNHQSCGSWRAM